jgi:hypothetical protein
MLKVVMQSPSFVVFRLKQQDGRKSFVKAVDDGEKARKNGSDCPKVLRPLSKRHRLPRLPKSYEWTIGERVVLVSLTGAGVVPTAIFGSFQGLVKSNGRKAAMVAWDKEDALVSSTVAIQRIRPIAFVPQ